jgi:hypothetical protein
MRPQLRYVITRVTWMSHKPAVKEMVVAAPFLEQDHQESHREVLQKNFQLLTIQRATGSMWG